MIAALVALVLAPAPADLVLENARIWTDGRAGFAKFAAVRDGRFLYIGETEKGYIGPQTERIDARGRVVLPGLIDSHAHMLSGGFQLSRVNLRQAKDRAEFVQLVADYAKTLKPGQWVLGGRWSVDSWADRALPRKEWIDAATGDAPAYLSRMDGHSGLANSEALRRAGITKDTPNPPGGVIDKDPATGEPTGILRETAQGLVTRHIPDPTTEESLAALQAAMKEANRLGITAVSDIPPLSALPVYEKMLSEGLQTVRFALYPNASAGAVAAAKARFKAKHGSVEIRGFKAYMDGSLGSRTAFMHEPFADNPADKKDWTGLPMPNMIGGGYLAECQKGSEAGLQAICHAIGDEANHQLLNILEAGYPKLRDARCRDEHTQHLLPADIARFGKLGVIASMQPYHKADDARYAEARIGLARSRSSYAFKSLLKAGAVVAFGSDWPVVSNNPFLGVEAAVTGKTLDHTFWMTQENLTVEEALRSYTSRGAYAMFMDKELGRIAPGFRADFVVLNASPFDRNPQWETIRPDLVAVEGKKVFVARPASNVEVDIRTGLGTVRVHLEPEKAPETVRNFLRYVEAGHYKNARFHRTVTMQNQPNNPIKIEVIQGGVDPSREKDDFPALKLERTSATGLKHLDGTISMARSGPDTATSDFFICIGGQPELDFGGKRNPDGQGFAAFGRVTKGMDVVRRIQSQPAKGQTLDPPISIQDIVRVTSASHPVNLRHRPTY